MTQFGGSPVINCAISRLYLEFGVPTIDNREFGFHVFVDSNLGAPRDEETGAPSIADGLARTHPTILAKSITGGVLMIGGAPEPVCQRQHLVAPDAHTGEVSAAGVLLNLAIPIRGFMHECRIHQAKPTPMYCDSASTIFVANDDKAVKRSVWVLRRAAVLREGVDSGEIEFVKISEHDNVADGLTKALKYETWRRHLDTHSPIPPSAKVPPFVSRTRAIDLHARGYTAHCALLHPWPYSL